MIRIHDIATGEVVDREMTAAEASAHGEAQAKFLADEQAKAGKEAAKVAILERLGITADEAALLLG